MIRGCVGTSSASRCARLGLWTNVLPDRLRKEHHCYTALSCCWLLLGHIFISFLIRVSPVDVGSSQRIYKMVSLHEANWVVPCAASLRSAVGALALLPYPESCGVTAEGLGLGCWLLSVTLLGQGWYRDIHLKLSTPTINFWKRKNFTRSTSGVFVLLQQGKAF